MSKTVRIARGLGTHRFEYKASLEHGEYRAIASGHTFSGSPFPRSALYINSEEHITYGFPEIVR